MRRFFVIVLLFLLPVQLLASPLIDQAGPPDKERHPTVLAKTIPSSLGQAPTGITLQEDVAHLLQTHVDISDAAVIIDLPATAAHPPTTQQPVYTPVPLTLLFFPVIKPPLI
jgi:hypothetical protein